MIDLEDIITVAAIGGQRIRNTIAQESTRGFNGNKLIFRRDTSRCIAFRFKYLSYLEEIIPVTTVQRSDRAVVVHIETIITAKSIDLQASIDVIVVVDPLYL